MKSGWAVVGTIAAAVLTALVSFQLWFFGTVFEAITDIRSVTSQLDREAVMAQRERHEIVLEIQRHMLGHNGDGER